MSGITIDVTGVPVVEVLLTVIAALLYYLARLLRELLQTVRALQNKPSTESSRTAALETPKPQPPSRPIKLSAEQFQACMLEGGDIDVALFIKACRSFCTQVLQVIGPFTVLSVREVHSNMQKVERSFELAPENYRSMRALLEAECGAGYHQAGGILADPSAAIGLLWARRGLGFWVEVFKDHESWLGAKHADNPEVLKLSVKTAYESTVGRFNGWVMQNSFSLALRTAPKAFPAFAPSEELLQEDLMQFVEAVGQLLTQMAAIHKALDLEDLRKSL